MNEMFMRTFNQIIIDKSMWCETIVTDIEETEPRSYFIEARANSQSALIRKY